ncbi:23663_t:CDS:2 [Gigaspora margarita]|uniref:23663_t:CDS:1 n=1 Tax=Gigaspora margarita TaxID=4874 RepID=A0ABN7V8D0_GIGMA|nr:23663_t:CDS:2 [Gigaspora margarita]
MKLKDLTLRGDGGYNLFTVHDKTHQGGYFHHRCAHEQSYIIPPDEPGEIGPTGELLIIPSKHRTIDAQNEQQRVKIAKLVVPPGTKKNNEVDEQNDNSNDSNDMSGKADNNDKAVGDNDEINDEFSNENKNYDDKRKLLLTQPRAPFTPLIGNKDDQEFSFKGVNLKISNCKIKNFNITVIY